VEKIIIQKNYMLKHFKIDINYQGYGVRDNNVERILDSFFYEFKDQTIELDYLISVIRKILDNYDENFLNIILVYKNSNNYEVSYVDKELSKYESFQELVLLNEYDYVGLIVRFDEYGINFSLTNNAGMILDSKIIEIINKELSKTVLLNNPKLLDFSYEDILLTKVYMLFYNENPDFSLEEVRIKTQCMLSILKFFNIIMNVHVNFHFDSKINIPVSSVTMERRFAKLVRIFLRMRYNNRDLKRYFCLLKNSNRLQTALQQADHVAKKHHVLMENLLVYMLDRYVLEAVDDGDYASRIKLCLHWCMMFFLILCDAYAQNGAPDEAKIEELLVDYSRHTEHNDRNLRILMRAKHII